MISQPEPSLLKPIGKDYLWGGSRLNDGFQLNIPLSPLAEAWVCSTHPDGASRVLSTGEDLLFCVDGSGMICLNNKFLNFYKGDCCIIPENSVAVKLYGKAQLLSASC